MIGSNNIESSHYQTGLYPEYLEKELKQKIEDPGMKIFGEVYKSKGAVILTRSQLEAMKKYLLVQIYRNPTNMSTYSPSWEGDILEINKQFNNDVEANLHVCDQIHEICTKSWSDLCKSENKEIRDNILKIKNTKTLFVKSDLLEFVINDMGSVCERQPYYFRDKTMTKKELEGVTGNPVSENKVNEWLQNHQYYDNFTFFPISSHFGIVTLSPLWTLMMNEKQPFRIVKPLNSDNDVDFQINMSFYDWMNEKVGLHSYFIMENYVPNINHYESEILNKATQKELPELLEKYSSPNDKYIYPVSNLTMDWASYLNILTINETHTIFSFGSNSDGNYSICKYIDYAMTHKDVINHDLRWVLDWDKDWNTPLN